MLAMKRKLVKLGSRHAAISFEFSFKGVWPANRYKVCPRRFGVGRYFAGVLCRKQVQLISERKHTIPLLPGIARRMRGSCFSTISDAPRHQVSPVLFLFR